MTNKRAILGIIFLLAQMASVYAADSWPERWTRLVNEKSKDGGQIYEYFVKLSHQDIFSDAFKYDLSSAKFSPNQHYQFVKAPMLERGFYDFLLQYEDALCPKNMEGWQKFKQRFVEGSLLRSHPEVEDFSKNYPLFQEMTADFCIHRSSLKTDPKWQACTKNMTNFLNTLVHSQSPSRLPGKTNLAYATEEEQNNFLKLFTDPMFGHLFTSTDVASNPLLALIQDISQVELALPKIDAKELDRFAGLQNEAIEKFKLRLKAISPEAKAFHVVSLDLNTSVFLNPGRLIIYKFHKDCINSYILTLNDAGFLKKLLASGRVDDVRLALSLPPSLLSPLTQCMSHPVTGRPFEQPIIFGENFKIQEVESSKKSGLAARYDFIPTHASFKCSECHVDVLKAPLSNWDPETMTEANRNAWKTFNREVAEKLKNHRQPVWIKELKPDGPNPLLVDRSYFDGPDLAFSRGKNDSKMLERILDRCLEPASQAHEPNFRKHIKTSMACGSCHVDEGRMKGMQAPIKIRLPATWEFNGFDASSHVKDFYFSSVIQHVESPWALMPPARASSSMVSPEEGETLRRCLLMGYYGRFLNLEPYVNHYFTASELQQNRSYAHDSESSLMGRWLTDNVCR